MTAEVPLGSDAIPEWTLGDRLRKAREHAGLSQAALAKEIGIGRTSAVSYETGNSEPSRPVLLSWALRCGVSLEWLAQTDPRPWGGPKAVAESGNARRRFRTKRFRMLRTHAA